MVDTTSEQTQVRDHPELSLLVIAPAGCGKTETLALRVEGLLSRQDVKSPQRILVTTFTNRARDNMRDRLSRYLTPHQMREAVTVCNFHGLSARIIQAHGNVVGVDPALWTMPQSDWVAQQCRARNLKSLSADVQSKISSVKRHGFSDEQVLAELERSGNEYAVGIERQRQSERRLTYDDLPRLAELILANDEVTRLYQRHFGAVIVDEFQDLTPQQLRIVQRIGYGRTTYAGDMAQGIYSFAGARPELVMGQLQAECSKTIEFAESFRSSPAVLKAVNSLSDMTGGQTLTAANPGSWPSDGFAGCINFTDTEEEARYITQFCAGILSQERAPRQRIGISARTKYRRRFVDQAIRNSGLQYSLWDEGVLDRSIAQKIRSMLREITLDKFRNADDPPEFVRQAARLDEEQDPDERTALSNAIDWCVDLLRDNVTPDEVEKRIQIGDTDSLITQGGVHLLTGHAGKGQQFDWMIIVGLEEECLPNYHAVSNAEIAEEARTFAVMLSRARHGVLVTSSDVVPDDYNPKRPKQRSRFLENVAPTMMTSRQEIRDWLAAADWQAIAAK